MVEREREIAASARTCITRLSALLGTQELDLGAHHRPQRKEKRQRLEPEKIASAPLRVEIGIEHSVRVGVEPAGAEIHEQKGKIIEHVHNGERIVELDGIKKDGPPLDLDDVAQMHIAMTLAHEARKCAPFQEWRKRLNRSPRRAAKRGHHLRREKLWVVRKGRLVVLQNRKQGTRSEHSCQEPVGAGVEPGNLLPEGSHGREGKPPLCCHAVIEARLLEAAHDQHPFRRLSLPTEVKSAVASARYGHNVEVKVGRRAAVQRELLKASGVALFQRRKVEERVFDRPLDLVGKFARQEHERCMGLNLPHLSGDWPIGLRPAHELQYLVL